MTYESNALAKTQGYYSQNGNYLAHFGIKGQKWGVRRYQNPDGTLTEAGRQRYMYDLGSGRKMSLIGRLKFSKDVRKKTEADEAQKFKKTKAFIDNIDSKSAEMQKTMKDYNKMDPASKKKFGNEVLDEIELCDNWFDEGHYSDTAKWASVETHQEALIDFVYNLATKKSGESWSNKSVSEGHRKALEEYNKAKLIDYHTGNNTDNVYTAGHKLVSAGLHDIGFEDTFENRKRCWQYFFDDSYPWYGYDSKHKVTADGTIKHGYPEMLQRTTEKGHAKAVAKREAQFSFSKMMNTFVGTPYADLLKRQNGR